MIRAVHSSSFRPRSVDVLPPKLHLGRLLQTVLFQFDVCLRPATAAPLELARGSVDDDTENLLLPQRNEPFLCVARNRA